MARIGKTAKVQQERLAAFGERYDCLSWDGGYLLYDKTIPGKRANHKFCGRFYLSTQGSCQYVFNDSYYDSPEDLLKAMDAYYSSLPFDAEIYNPINRKNYVIECAAHDYLISIGFICDKKGVRCDKYNYSDVYGQHICFLEVYTEFNTSKGKIKRKILSTDKIESWQEVEFTDLESAIGAINSLIASYLGIVQAQLMNSLRKLTSSRAAKVYTRTFDASTLTTYTEEAKAKTIEFLESELRQLKE